jgi:hypothetical protein
MRLAAFGLITITALGCNTAKYDVSVPQVEEYRIAPDESRYNTPPEQGYKAPPPKKEFKPGFGGNAGGMGPGGRF